MKRTIQHELNQMMKLQDDEEQLYAFYNLIQDTTRKYSIDDTTHMSDILTSPESKILMDKHKDVVLNMGITFKNIQKAYEEKNKGL